MIEAINNKDSLNKFNFILHILSSKFILIFTIILNLGILFYFKYMNFFATQIGISNWKNIILPIGISFYIFQGLSYTIDVWRKQTEVQKNLFKFALYVSLFPQLIAGPIVKYHDIDEQLNNRTITFDDVLYGIRRFILGLSKKMLIANTFGYVADNIFNSSLLYVNAGLAWLGAISYTFQIFFDFSAYSDMAIGLMRIFGFKILENFNYPYTSKSVTEFWRRWHISLSTWFKEYLYIPLGGNRTGHTMRNLWLVFLATGIWHGAEWTFILWGLFHGFFIVLEKKIGVEKFIGWKGHIYTMLVVIFGWILFRSPNINFALDYIKTMFGFGIGNNIYGLKWYISWWEVLIFITGIIISFPVFKNILATKKNVLLNIWLIFLFIISAVFLAADTYNPFIYFRF